MPKPCIEKTAAIMRPRSLRHGGQRWVGGEPLVVVSRAVVGGVRAQPAGHAAEERWAEQGWAGGATPQPATSQPPTHLLLACCVREEGGGGWEAEEVGGSAATMHAMRDGRAPRPLAASCRAAQPHQPRAATHPGAPHLGSDGGGQRVVTADADAQAEAPEGHDRDDAEAWEARIGRLRRGRTGRQARAAQRMQAAPPNAHAHRSPSPSPSSIPIPSRLAPRPSLLLALAAPHRRGWRRTGPAPRCRRSLAAGCTGRPSCGPSRRPGCQTAAGPSACPPARCP